jgi:hypothetical protein
MDAGSAPECRYLNDGYGNGELVLWNTVYALDPLNGTNEFGITPEQGKLPILMQCSCLCCKLCVHIQSFVSAVCLQVSQCTRLRLQCQHFRRREARGWWGSQFVGRGD